eukprot:c25558_g2_i3 orf=234-1457(+)
MKQPLSAIQNDYDWALVESFSHVTSSMAAGLATEGQPSDDFPDEELWAALPDDLWERILSVLPVTNILRAGTVCKRWNSIISSKRFLNLRAGVDFDRAWYFMYKDYRNAAGLAYDPLSRKWHSFGLPYVDTSSWFVASANGLVCFMDNSNGGSILYVFNPMTKIHRKLPEPAEKWNSDYYTVSLTVHKETKALTAVVARSNQMPDDYSHWNLTIEVYESESNKWRTTAKTLLHGWRGGENSVICNGIFYCVTYSTAMVGGVSEDTSRHGLVTYRLSDCALNASSMAMPCSLTCVKLMNCKDRLLMVGGIGKSDIIKGIGIWELDTEWREIAKMPNKYFRGFGEFDDVFASSGSGDIIYIHSFGSPQLLLFDMLQRSWRWSQKCPLVKKHPLQLFTGFCFEPRLEACD